MPGNSIYHCRICGLGFTEPPWGLDGKSPSFDICGCCGVEHGYEDCKLDAIRQYRAKWLNAGAKWFEPKLQPEDWSAAEQMKNIPPEFN